jgi:predicted lactoylglutathione lyase
LLRWAKNIRDLKLRQANQRAGAQQLNNTLTKARRRPVKSAMKHNKKKGTKTKQALRRIGMFYQKAPKEAFDTWRRWMSGDKNKFAKLF